MDNVRLYSYQQLPETYHCVLPSGVGETDVQSAITVSPNPGNGVFAISGLRKDDKIEVLNLLGEKVASQIIQENRANTSLDLTRFVKGIYVYKVISKDGKIYSGKIIKE